MWFSKIRRPRRLRNNYIGDLSEVYLGERNKIFGDSAPDVEFTFCLGPHGAEEDADILEDALSDVDIYLPEVTGWGQYTEEMYEFVSMGKMTPDDVLATDPNDRAPYVAGRFVKMAKCNALVRLIDIPCGHSLSGKSVKSMEAYRSREAYIMREIPRAIKSAFDANPALIGLERPVSVVISYGSLHSAMSLALKMSGESVCRVFPEKPYVYPEPAVRARINLFYEPYEPIEMIDE